MLQEFSGDFDKVEITYDLTKYKEKTDSWAKGEGSYVERYFNIYYAKSKPNSKFSNQLIYQSPSSISLIMLDGNHSFMKLKELKDKIEKIDIVCNKDILENPAKGKRKKGAFKLEPNTVLLTINVKINQVDKIEELNFPIGANLYGSIIEINQKVIDDPFILFERFNLDAYLAIILPTSTRSPVNDPPVEMVAGRRRKDKEEKEEEGIEIKSTKLSKYDKRRIQYNQQLVKDAENVDHPLITIKSNIFNFEGEIIEEDE